MSIQKHPIEIKQIRSASFNSNYKPYERRQSQSNNNNQTFECQQKSTDQHSIQSTGQDLIETEKQSQMQMLQVLEQQININQYLEQQINQLQSKLMQQQKIIDDSRDVYHVLEQLQIYKEIVEQLELKIKDIVSENQNLIFTNQQYQQRVNYLEEEIIKFQQIIDDKIHEQVRMSPDISRKLKRLIEENQLLKQTNKQMEDEVNELRNNLEQFKQSIQTLRDQSPDDNAYVNELENQIQYLQDMQQIDSVKMQALEEKLNLQNKENLRLQELLKQKRKNN